MKVGKAQGRTRLKEALTFRQKSEWTSGLVIPEWGKQRGGKRKPGLGGRKIGWV